VGQVPGTDASPGAGLSPELRSAIEEFISENKVVAFIKGTKQFPSCGFSNTVVQILNAMQVPYVTVNVLEDDLLRSGMKEYSQWPTFPQVYIDGDFFGGADIMIAAYTSGELAETLEAALNS
jgi:monothiol glutaredoxin